MHALTLDHLSGGRMVLGMGVSGPQVVEGWYGQPFSKPLARTREVVDIIRKVLAREGAVTNDGPHYPLPFHGEASRSAWTIVGEGPGAEEDARGQPFVGRAGQLLTKIKRRLEKNGLIRTWLPPQGMDQRLRVVEPTEKLKQLMETEP